MNRNDVLRAGCACVDTRGADCCPEGCPFYNNQNCKDAMIAALVEQMQERPFSVQDVLHAAYEVQRRARLLFNDEMPAGEILAYIDGVTEMTDELLPGLEAKRKEKAMRKEATA